MMITSLSPALAAQKANATLGCRTENSVQPHFAGWSKGDSYDPTQPKSPLSRLLQLILWPFKAIAKAFKKLFQSLTGVKENVVQGLNAQAGQAPEDNKLLSPAINITLQDPIAATTIPPIQPEALHNGFYHLGRNYYTDPEGRVRSALRVMAMAEPTDECLAVFAKRLSPEAINEAFAYTQTFLEQLKNMPQDSREAQQPTIGKTGREPYELGLYLSSLSSLGKLYDPDTKTLPTFENLVQSRQWMNAILETKGNFDASSNWLPKPINFKLKK